MIQISDLKLGDSIRSYDFEPRFLCADRFVDGHIIDITENTITVDIQFDSVFGVDEFGVAKQGSENARPAITTPLSMTWGEWNGRLQLCTGGRFEAIETKVEALR